MKLVKIFKLLNAVCGHTENGNIYTEIDKINAYMGSPGYEPCNPGWFRTCEDNPDWVTEFLTKLKKFHHVNFKKLISSIGVVGVPILKEGKTPYPTINTDGKVEHSEDEPSFSQMYKDYLVTHKSNPGDLVPSFEAFIHSEIDFEDDNFKHVNRAAGIKDWWNNITQLAEETDEDKLKSSIQDLFTKLEGINTTFLSYTALLSKGVGIQSSNDVIYWAYRTDQNSWLESILNAPVDATENIVNFILKIWSGMKTLFTSLTGGSGAGKIVSRIILGLVMFGGAMFFASATWPVGIAIAIAIIIIQVASFFCKTIEQLIDFLIGIGIYLGISVNITASYTAGIPVMMFALAIVIARKIYNSISNWMYPTGGGGEISEFTSKLAKNFTGIGPNDIEFDDKSITETDVSKKLLQLYINKFKGGLFDGGGRVMIPPEQDEGNKSIKATDLNGHNIFKFNYSASNSEGQRIILNIKQSIKVIDILPAKIKQAIVEQPTSYDPNLGLKLQKYDKNRMKFLQDMREEEKKKSS